MRLWGWSGRHGMWQKHSLTISSWWVNQVFIHRQGGLPSPAGPTHKHQFSASSDRRYMDHTSLIVAHFLFLFFLIYFFSFLIFYFLYLVLFQLPLGLWRNSEPGISGGYQLFCPGWINEASPCRRRRWPLRCRDQILIPTAILKPPPTKNYCATVVGHCGFRSVKSRLWLCGTLATPINWPQVVLPSLLNIGATPVPPLGWSDQPRKRPFSRWSNCQSL